MKRAVAYIRVSSENQVESGYGLAEQKRSVTEFAKKSGIEIVKYFSDEGVSGAKGKEHRINLARLFDYIDENPDIDFVIIPELSRLARNLVLQEVLIEDFQNRGVDVLCVNGEKVTDDDPDRTMIRQIIGSVNQQQRRRIGARMRAGRLEKARQGEHAVGRIPYGYRSVTQNGRKVLEKVPEEIEVVKTIFYLKDVKEMPYRAIAEYLNEQGYKPPRSDKWIYTSVRKIYLNPKYKGIIKLNEGGTQIVSENEKYRVV